jgi:rhodanese-related sulfurtransferase
VREPDSRFTEAAGHNPHQIPVMKNFDLPAATAAGIVARSTTEPARPACEKPATNTAESPTTADRAALIFSGEPARDLLPEEADAWASFVSAVEVNHAIAEKRDMVVVDVRAPEDYAQGHVPGAVSLPREKWDTAAGLSREKINVVYCYSHTCPLGGEACAKLVEQGYPVIEMDGGFEVWESSNLEVAQ